MSVSYLNDLGDSDGLQEAIGEETSRVPGWSAGVTVGMGDVTVIAEYLGATDRFQADDIDFSDRGAQPSSWMIEAAYGLSLVDKDVTVAASFQQTHEAVALELPRSRTLIGFSVGLMEQVSLAVEWAHHNDYGVEDRGSGENANTLVIQLTAEF